jgi:tRNA modification GTPase
VDARGIAVDALDRRVRVVWVRDPAGRALDQVLALAMRAPGSFTGEDVAELHATMGRSPSSAAGVRAIRSTRDSCAPDRTGESQRPGENGVPGETTNCSL